MSDISECFVLIFIPFPHLRFSFSFASLSLLQFFFSLEGAASFIHLVFELSALIFASDSVFLLPDFVVVHEV